MKKLQKITNNLIKNLKPCKERFENYLNHYKNQEFTMEQFLDLDKITFKDKIWVLTKLLDKNQNIEFSILCAESVLSNFESKYLNDDRPRKAIVAAKNYLKNPSINNKNAANAAYAADAAAYAADAAAYVAYTAACAAANAAYAADAAAYAAYTAAACDAYNAATDREKQEKLILNFALKVYKNQ